MRAFVITGPGKAEVQDVKPPEARAGEVVVDVARAGVCGTDMEIYSGAMSYLHTGQAQYPMRIGHEWSGTVASVGPGVDEAWLGRRVTGDTMLGCGHCARCTSGRQHVCADRYEIGVRNGWPGALAEQLPVPVKALQVLPDSVDPAAGAMVEPAGNALRAVRGVALPPGGRLLILGPGAIGLLTAQVAAAQGAEVHLLGRSATSLEFAASIGFPRGWTTETLPDLTWDGVIDASNGAALPALAVDLVEPGRRVVFVGLSSSPSLIDSRNLALKDVTAVGVLSASGGFAGTVELFASGEVDPRPLIAATVGLDDVAAVLAGDRSWGAAPKIHVDPRS
ncbi:zinc-dependent alcohol dehydrogenase [Actinoplanes friuliensis]|uniref:Dehydrogenase n=1 Tax=Actinoplanes friuliensis DSM 7358 TaxID=1246995 RepID=U5VXG8_9ACTN|nr:alcohol dehydrogenase catalytic domain-containing protein [Actinoplanes friuliensis]AGZ40430.1 dehydrogenase [Actinoplanes friuliensis DSM 7358]